jgi:iron complex transport system substrate-binding protein
MVRAPIPRADGHDRSQPPGRIVSLVPSVTELMYAIGAQDLLVGVTDFSATTRPPQRARSRAVGGMLAPSLETLVAL